MDAILSSLTKDQLAFVEHQLTNNEVSSDNDLQTLFVEAGLTELQALRTIHYRPIYSQQIFREGSTPIVSGAYALRYSADSGSFELICRQL